MAELLVSIVIPCYKGEAYLSAAIESCLRQTYAAIEVLVVDDASPDQCATIADRYAALDSRVKVLRHASNGGVSRAFNTGYSASRGAYLSRLAQDDLFEPEAVETMVAYLEAHPSVGLVYCDYRKVDPRGEPVAYIKTPEPEEALRYGNRVGLCVMWRREVWESVGGFDPAFDSVDDYEYWSRVAEKFAFGRCGHEGALLQMRVHPGMGSKVFSVKQEILAAQLLAKQVPGKVEAAKALKDGYFNAAYNASEQHNPRDAFRYLLKAAMCWPFDFRLFKLLGRLVIGEAKRD